MFRVKGHHLFRRSGADSRTADEKERIRQDKRTVRLLISHPRVSESSSSVLILYRMIHI